LVNQNGAADVTPDFAFSPIIADVVVLEKCLGAQQAAGLIVRFASSGVSETENVRKAIVNLIRHLKANTYCKLALYTPDSVHGFLSSPYRQNPKPKLVKSKNITGPPTPVSYPNAGSLTGVAAQPPPDLLQVLSAAASSASASSL